MTEHQSRPTLAAYPSFLFEGNGFTNENGTPDLQYPHHHNHWAPLIWTRFMEVPLIWTRIWQVSLI